MKIDKKRGGVDPPQTNHDEQKATKLVTFTLSD